MHKACFAAFAAGVHTVFFIPRSLLGHLNRTIFFLLITFLCFSYLYIFLSFCHAHPSAPSFCNDSTVLFPTAPRTQCI